MAAAARHKGSGWRGTAEALVVVFAPMSKDDGDDSELVRAARAFDTQLRRFARASESARKRPLDTEKNLARVGAALEEAAAAETEFGPTAHALIAALQAARAEQERQVAEVQVRVKEYSERATLFAELVARYKALGEQAAGLTGLAQTLSAKKRALDPDVDDTKMLATSLGELDQRVLLVTADAQGLAQSAREAGFQQVADEAHSLYQTIASVRNKLNLLRQSFGGPPPPS